MVYSRQEFAAHRFPYKAGQHVIFGGPTGQGKTRLAGALLTYAASPSCPALVAVTKPDDKETADLGARLGYRRVTTWPPPPKWKETFGEKPSGYLIWPQFGDIDTDTDRAAEITGDLMAHTYAGGAKGKHAILVMDDTMVKARVLHLDGRMVTILAMAGAMGVGLWIFVQKPTDSGRTTLWGFENGTHFFMAKGGEGRMRDRYVEIAGDNGPIVKRTLPTLKPYQFLYIHRYEGWVCIVDAN
jgi:hypothetical protein